MLLVGGLISAGVHTGVFCNNRRKKNKLYKNKLSSLIISKGCGKTTLKKSLSSLKSDLVIIDLNEVIKTNNNDRLEFLEKAKIYVDNILKLFKTKRFLILCSSHDESNFLNVSKLFTFTVCPSNNLLKQIMGDCTDEDKRNDIQKKYLELIRETDQDKLNVFSSFNELYTVIKKEYKLQSNF